MATINREFEYDIVCSSYIRADGARIRQGGVSVLWRRSLALAVKPLSKIGDYGQILQLTRPGEKTVFIINVYLPAANHGYAPFEEALSKLRDLYYYYSQSGLIILCGDFNSHVSSGERSLHSPNADRRRVDLLQRFLDDTNQISLVTSSICTGPMETYYPYDGSRGTQIDHVMMHASDVTDYVISTRVHGDHELNTSDHVPISVTIFGTFPQYNVKTKAMYRWDKADPSLYERMLGQEIVDRGLSNMVIHDRNDIDRMCDAITQCMIDSSNLVVPKSQYICFFYSSNLEISYIIHAM